MSATPIDNIPWQVLDSIGSTMIGRVPSCGCQRDGKTLSYFLCPYRDGMTDGFHIAQQLNREAT